MSFYSEDSASPAAPFSGDSSVLEHPDVFAQSPTTSERVVDTQSGFLVVIKRMGERLALSCKRRVGTPPSSAILLTPDESIKLSKILSSSVIGLDEPSPEQPASRLAVGGRRRFGFTVGPSARAQAGSPFAGIGVRIAAVVGALLVVGGVVYGAYSVGAASHKAAVAVTPDALSTANVDKFARSFVSEMLDFNPATYKMSQVQAMSSMSPDLLEKYWKETNFPLTSRQLKSLPQGANVVVDRITQEHSAKTQATVDIFAQIVRPDSKIASPLHIKLQLGLNEAGGIRVLEQEDLTSR